MRLNPLGSSIKKMIYINKISVYDIKKKIYINKILVYDCPLKIMFDE